MLNAEYAIVISERDPTPATARLWDALRDVMDPEIPISVVDMGLIVDLWERAGEVRVKITFTAMGCPAMDMILDDVRERLLHEPGVRRVEIEVVWDPIWTSDRLTEEGRQTLLELGIAV